MDTEPWKLDPYHCCSRKRAYGRGEPAKRPIIMYSCHVALIIRAGGDRVRPCMMAMDSAAQPSHSRWVACLLARSSSSSSWVGLGREQNSGKIYICFLIEFSPCFSVGKESARGRRISSYFAKSSGVKVFANMEWKSGVWGFKSTRLSFWRKQAPMSPLC